MGLDMKTRKKLTEETAKRYCTASKKQKGIIIDEFVANTGYNRKYAIHILKNTARTAKAHKQLFVLVRDNPEYSVYCQPVHYG